MRGGSGQQISTSAGLKQIPRVGDRFSRVIITCLEANLSNTIALWRHNERLLHSSVASLAVLRIKFAIFDCFKRFWNFFFEERPNEIWLPLAFFDQFNFYVGLADLKIILEDFWTQNDKILLETLH